LAKKDDIQLAKEMATKRIRNAVRLELAIRGTIILNELLDEFGTEYDRRVAAGEVIELTGYQDWVRAAVDVRAPLALLSGAPVESA